jgi:hypothetical protein
MLPANVQHAALSLSSGYLYGQTFYVEGLESVMNHLLHFRSRDLRSWFRARLGAHQLAYLQTVSATIKLLDDRLVVRLMIILINQALDNVIFSSIKPLFDGINQAAW